MSSAGKVDTAATMHAAMAAVASLSLAMLDSPRMPLGAVPGGRLSPSENHIILFLYS